MKWWHGLEDHIVMVDEDNRFLGILEDIEKNRKGLLHQGFDLRTGAVGERRMKRAAYDDDWIL